MEYNDEIMFEIMRYLSTMLDSDILEHDIRLNQMMYVIPNRLESEVASFYIVDTLGRCVEDLKLLALEGELRVFEVKHSLRNIGKKEL